MHIVTGGAGFIGSAMVWQLNSMGLDDILVVDTLGTGDKWKNLVNLRFRDYLPKAELLRRIEAGQSLGQIKAVIHMGACSSTTEKDADYLWANNVSYSRKLIAWALEKGARVINASSAATYGDGSLGFDDSLDTAIRLKPLNMYGYSKQAVDMWLYRTGLLPRVASLKFFNVYGPNEYHKGDMQSVVSKAFRQINETGVVRLFRSTEQDIPDGGQRRDFVYVKDCVAVMAWLLEHPGAGGILNLGTGLARSFKDLVTATFGAMGLPPNIEYIDMPQALRGKYQSYTQAAMNRLRAAGCQLAFHSLEDGVADYVKGHLAAADPYLATGVGQAVG